MVRGRMDHYVDVVLSGQLWSKKISPKYAAVYSVSALLKLSNDGLRTVISKTAICISLCWLNQGSANG